MSKGGWFLLGILACSALASVRAAAADGDDKAASPWLNDWEAGRKAARESDKPLFVVFRCES